MMYFCSKRDACSLSSFGMGHSGWRAAPKKANWCLELIQYFSLKRRAFVKRVSQHLRSTFSAEISYDGPYESNICAQISGAAFEADGLRQSYLFRTDGKSGLPFRGDASTLQSPSAGQTFARL